MGYSYYGTSDPAKLNRGIDVHRTDLQVICWVAYTFHLEQAKK